MKWVDYWEMKTTHVINYDSVVRVHRHKGKLTISITTIENVFTFKIHPHDTYQWISEFKKDALGWWVLDVAPCHLTVHKDVYEELKNELRGYWMGME